jgi:alpha-glucosidase/alpha-D-xyloside xylohydrolase
MNHLLSAGARLVSAAFLGVSLAAMGHAAAQSAPRPAPTGSRLALAGSDAEITISAVSEATIRIRIDSAQASARPAEDSVLVQSDWPGKKQRITSPQSAALFKFGKIHVAFTSRPLVVAVEGADGRVAQRLRFDEQTGNFTFLLGDGPVFGLGAGGPQFDRRGNAYSMKNSHGGYQLATHGGRLPIPWLIGTSGWAMFVHTPLGAFDLTGQEGRFQRWDSEFPLPLDVFIVASREPATLMREYARITGLPHMPPLWALGYQQSHRTLASRDEIMGIARTLREKKLPCDVLIYLGTGWCPSGWNTGHGSFTWNSTVFPDPAKMIQEMHDLNFKMVLHAVYPPAELYGRAGDEDVPPDDRNAAANYWKTHLEVARLGVDGWWPDAAENLSIESRLARNRMYWEGPQLEHPNVRPYALHRTGYAGLQRYGWFWSGDVNSTWKTLATHIPVALNTVMSGIPYWGTDIGGFYTTPEFTGELYVRWFQFMAFSPLFRAHGRTWKLRLPWGWNTGEFGVIEPNPDIAGSGLPDPSELHNAAIEPICRKYMELRYRMMPYVYSLVNQTHETGIPMMRPLWMHYSDDAKAVARSDEYLWGRDMLVAPVVEKGATARSLYLPAGEWYDFWTEEKTTGGSEISRAVNLETMPLYVRAGTILPMGPVKQYTLEKVEGPLSLTVYPGADGDFTLYQDDGTTFNFEKGEWSKLRFAWNDARRRLSLSTVKGSRPVVSLPRRMEIRLAGDKNPKTVEFNGKDQTLSF